MAENLRVSKYNNGNIIRNVINDNEWSGTNNPCWAFYKNDSVNYSKYGKLYSWNVIKSVRNVCPVGWHVPSAQEWIQLTDYLGGYLVAGGKMKEVDTVNWNSPNTDASNLSLFNALPGGYRYLHGVFMRVNQGGFWWSSSVYNTEAALAFSLGSSSGSSNKADGTYDNNFGFSIRCIKD
jgi:uncharacterized protein (TIGR02145 family)